VELPETDRRRVGSDEREPVIDSADGQERQVEGGEDDGGPEPEAGEAAGATAQQ
jgi:hypothetical protein